MSSPTEVLQALLTALRTAAPGTSLSSALAGLIPPEPAGLTETRRRCALVRAFDPPLYHWLTENVPGAPAFELFTQEEGVRRLASGRFILTDPLRTPLLTAWQSDHPEEWRDWNQRLVQYFVDRGRADERLDALYHWAASPKPQGAVESFRTWYAEAEAAFDLPQCNALLEILKVQQSHRGIELSREWQQYTQYYQARLLFCEDYYKTGAFFERPLVLEAFESVLSADPPCWIFHIHATGGTGKTIFLRWLIARYLLPRRIPCARVDADEHPLNQLLEYPGVILASIIDQLARQVSGSVLTDLRSRLNKELLTPGWNQGIAEEVGRQLRSARIDSSLVIVLDTLEEITRIAQPWLKECIQWLRQLHTAHPGLVLILSGRYDISTQTTALQKGEYVSLELERFTEDEAHAYLQHRGIPASKTRTAIVERAAGDVSDPKDEALSGRNPFKLAMFAELALNAVLTPEDVWRLPRVDIAYLIQRVILRIASQPLRWAIRYGAIARHLNKGFVEAVLLPPLREALRGKVADQPNDNLGGIFRDVWQPDLALAESITAGQIWDELKSYARERGWVSLTSTPGDPNEELRFHPDVINPTRELLREQSVFRELQQLALSFFEERLARESERDEPNPTELAKLACEAVFHHWQFDRPEAVDYWLRHVRALERFGPGVAKICAQDITGNDYARQQVFPREQLTTTTILRTAHCEVADLILQEAGLNFTPGGKLASEFQRRVEWAFTVKSAIVLTVVPRYLQLIRETTLAKASHAIQLLEAELQHTRNDRERCFLLMVLARRLRRSDPGRAAPRYDELMTLIQRGVSRIGIQPFDLAVAQSELYEELGQHNNILAALENARTFANTPRQSALVAYREGSYRLSSGDLGGTWAQLETLRDFPESVHPRRNALQLLKIRYTLACGDAIAAAQLATQKLPGLVRLERAQLLDQQGVAQGRALDFNAAFDTWENAAAAYDRSKLTTGAARCALLAARLKALDCGNIYEAVSRVAAASGLRGLRDAQVHAEFELLRIYLSYRQLRQEDAREALKSLRAYHATWTRSVRARVLLFGLIFNLAELDRPYLSELYSALADIEPTSARAELLDWCEFSQARPNLTPDALGRLQALFDLGGVEQNIPLASHLGRVHFLWILQLGGFAKDYLAGLEERLRPDSDAMSWFSRWQVQLARRKLALPTNFRALVGPATQAVGGHPGLLEAVHLEAAREALDAGDSHTAAQLLSSQATFKHLKSQGLTRWLARIAELENFLSTVQSGGSADISIREVWQQLGDQMSARRVGTFVFGPAADPPGLEGLSTHPPDAKDSDIALASHSYGVVTVTPLGLDPAWENEGYTLDRLLADGGRAATEFSDALQRATVLVGSDLVLNVPPQFEGLPWELAPFLAGFQRFWRATPHTRALLPPTGSRLRVLLVQPSQSSRESYSNSAGGDLAQLWRYAAGLAREQLYILTDPSPETLQTALLQWQPSVLHINCAVRDTGGGISLDFASTESRATQFGDDSGFESLGGASIDRELPQQELVWTTTRLARVLELPWGPPTVIVDIDAAHNPAETVRRLLLRNRFCSQLFQIGGMQAVLAVGLSVDERRTDTTLDWIQGFVSGGASRALLALRAKQSWGPPVHEFAAALPRYGAALWAHDSDAAGPPP